MLNLSRLIAVFFIFSFAILSVAANDNSEIKTIKLATCEWAPFSGKKIKNQGITTSIIKKCFNDQFVKVQIDFMPWSRVIKVVQNGEYDAAYPAYYSKEREKHFKYSKYFMASPIHFCVTKNSKITFKSLEDMKAYKIGIVNGYVNSREFDAATFLNKKKANNDKTNLFKLVNNRVDTIVIDKYASEYYKATNKEFANVELKYLDPPLETKKLFLLVSKNISHSDKIIKIFNKGIDNLTKSGNLNNLLNQY